MDFRRILNWLILLFVGGIFMGAHSMERKYVRFVDKVNDTEPTFQNKHFPNKIKRLSNKKGQIEFLFDEVLPDSILIALDAAKDLWESKISGPQKILIQILFEPLDNQTVTKTEVSYSIDPNWIGYPTALISQKTNLQIGTVKYPDGIISFNVDKKWNCTFAEQPSESYNITSYALREIARCFGFGTSLLGTNCNDLDFAAYEPSPFDKYIYNSSHKLSDLITSTQRYTFATSEDVCFKSRTASYKLYSPKEFQQGQSLCYIDNYNTLMSHHFGPGGFYLDIDDTTIDILNMLGWNIPVISKFWIKSNDISENGIGSAYTDHSFHIWSSSGLTDIINYNWKFSLKDKDGNFKIIQTGNSENFNINAIRSNDTFYTNLNGDLVGKIECVHA